MKMFDFSKAYGSGKPIYGDGIPLFSGKHPKLKIFSRRWWKGLFSFFRRPRMSKENLEKVNVMIFYDHKYLPVIEYIESQMLHLNQSPDIEHCYIRDPFYAGMFAGYQQLRKKLIYGKV